MLLMKKPLISIRVGDRLWMRQELCCSNSTRASRKACTASPAGSHPEEHVQTHTSHVYVTRPKIVCVSVLGVCVCVPLLDSLNKSLF